MVPSAEDKARAGLWAGKVGRKGWDVGGEEEEEEEGEVDEGLEEGGRERGMHSLQDDVLDLSTRCAPGGPTFWQGCGASRAWEAG